MNTELKISYFSIVTVATFGLMLVSALFPNAFLAPLSLGIIFFLVLLYSRNTQKSIPYFLLYLFQCQFYISYGLVPNVMAYLMDIMLVVLLYQELRMHGKSRFNGKMKRWALFWGIFFALGLIVNMIYDFQPILYVWAFRNNIRFMAFFLFCCMSIEKTILVRLLPLFDIAFLFTILLVYIQHHIDGLSGDLVGGIFGIANGSANAFLNVFLVVYFTLMTVLNIVKKVSIFKWGLVSAFCVYIAAIAELKIVFIELLVIVLLSYLFTNLSVKHLIRFVIISCILGLVLTISIPILYEMFPMFNNFFTVETIMRTATRSYTGQNDLSRLNSIVEINERFFLQDPLFNLFGLGLGSAEFANSSFLSSTFYMINQSSNYHFFSLGILFLETGFLGLGLLVSPFISYLKYLFKARRNNPYCSVSLVLICLLPVLFVYNTTFRIDIAYLLALGLSLGYMVSKTREG